MKKEVASTDQGRSDVAWAPVGRSEPPRDDGPLVLALPKGRVLKAIAALLGEIGVDASAPLSDSRKLVFDLGGDARVGGPFRALVVRGMDVPAYVEGGAADVGVAGLDVIREHGGELFEPLDLGLGRCRLVVAEPADRPPRDGALARLRVATKYPEITHAYFLGRGEQVDVIALHGAIELAPLVGLSDRIVDLVESGETLRQNNLRVVEEIAQITSRVIVSRVSLKTRAVRVRALLTALGAALARRQT